MTSVVPIFKIKDSCVNPANYRPTSLICICYKLLEHMIYSSISIHLELVKYKIICKEQHGFRKQYSCESRLLDAVKDIAYNLDIEDQTDMILLQKLLTKCYISIFFTTKSLFQDDI